jgi:hypothetical protein
VRLCLFSGSGNQLVCTIGISSRNNSSEPGGFRTPVAHVVE